MKTFTVQVSRVITQRFEVAIVAGDTVQAKSAARQVLEGAPINWDWAEKSVGPVRLIAYVDNREPANDA